MPDRMYPPRPAVPPASLEPCIRVRSDPAPAEPLLRPLGLDLAEMVILDLACQTECTLRALRFHPHHSNLAFESLFQVLSIRIMSWDFEGTDKPFPGGER